MHWPRNPIFRQLGRFPPRAHHRKGTKLASRSCIHESETLLVKRSSAPIRVCSGNQRFPISPLDLSLPWARRVWLRPAPWALALCWWSLEMETNSKRALLQGEGGWGMKRPCVPWPQHPTFLQVRRDTARAHLRKGTKLGFGSCVRESESLLGKPSSAPIRVCSGKQRFLVSTLANCLS